MSDSSRKQHRGRYFLSRSIGDSGELSGHALFAGDSSPSGKSFQTVIIAPYIAYGLALAWWAAAAAFLLGRFGLEGFLGMSFELKIAALALASMPGMVLLVAGFMIMEVRRSQEASAAMVEVARQLLAPVESAGAEFDVIANMVSTHTHRISGDMARACQQADLATRNIESSMNGLARISEIIRTNGAELVEQLNTESNNITMAETKLRSHLDELIRSFSDQARTLTISVRNAEQEIGRAEQIVENRAGSLGTAGAELASKITQIDKIASGSEEKIEALSKLLSGLNERSEGNMEQVADIVSNLESVRELSGSMIADIDSALGQMDERSKKLIASFGQQMELSGANGAEIMKQIDISCDRAGAKIEEITALADKQLAVTEEKMASLGNSVFETAVEATRIAESGLERARVRIESAARMLENPDSAIGFGEEQKHDYTPPPRLVLPETAASADSDVGQTNAPPPSGGNGPLSGGIASRDLPQSSLDNAGNTPVAPRESALPRAGGGVSWRTLLADIDDARPGDSPPENASQTLINDLQEAGVHLGQAVTAPDLRRIAAAARYGEQQRRQAIRKAAPGQLRYVEDMFARSPELRLAAQDFLASEADAALKTLNMAETARQGADPYLSAYLLIDTALATQTKAS